ncbi:MAG: hypothetical protein NTX38_17655 [Methylobacter sp.]|nr:hypothetical protein [Methylobacter sp.]
MQRQQIIKMLFWIIIFFSSFAYPETNNFGVDIPDGEYYSAYYPNPWFLVIYIFFGLWLIMNEKSPMYIFSKKHPGIAICAFLFVVPIILAILGIGF